MNTWQDISTFSRGDTDRTPKTWQLKTGDFKITVTRRIHYPGTWIYSCEPLAAQIDLGTNDAEVAKTKAMDFFRRSLTFALDNLPS